MCKEKRECVYCGAEYRPKQPHQKFCSRECSSKHLSAKYEKVAITTETRQCVACGGDFTWKSTAPNQKFCSSSCYPKQQPREKWTETRKCEMCGGGFTWKSTAPTKKFCSSACMTKAQYVNPGSSVIVDKQEECPVSHLEDKHYVYGWYDGDLLFYVGKGTGDRYKVRHRRDDGVDAWCEIVKRNAKNFRCLMLRTGLTDRESRLIESTLIFVCKPYTNVLQRSI